MKILYLYVSARAEIKKKFDIGEGPDTLLYGLNHLAAKHQVSFSDTGLRKNIWWFICLPIEVLLIKLTGYGFKLSQILSNFAKINKSDCVVGCGSSAGLPLGLLRSFGFFRQTKLVLINIGLVDLWDKFPFFIKNFYRRIYKNIDLIICFSEIEKDLIVNKVKISQSKVHFLPLGIDTSFFNTSSKMSDEFILSAGRDKGRDFKSIFDLARNLKTEKFVVITSPRNVVGLVTPSNLEVLFDVDYQILREHYKRAKIVLLSLRPVERASGQLVLLEALAMGKPVIATHSPGLLAGYEKIKKFVITAPSNPDALKIAITSLESKRMKLNNASARIIKQNYSTATMAASLEKIIMNS